MVLPKKRAFILIAAIILVVAIVLSSFLYLNFQKPYTGNVESVTVGLLPNEVNTLIYIANEKNYFSSNGLNLTFRNYESGLACANAVLSGNVDIATTSEFIITSKIMGNQNISTFATIVKSFDEFIVCRTDSGINNISDLLGKRIGVIFGTATQFHLYRFLELNGVNTNKVTFVNLAPSAIIGAITNGTVDAVITWQPNIGTIESQLPNRTISFPAQEQL